MTVKAPPYAFRGKDPEFFVRFVVKNTGSATAPETRTVLLLRRPGIGGLVAVSMPTPHLAPGKAFRGHRQQALHLGEHASLGAYRLRVCPDSEDALSGPRPRCAKKGSFYLAEKEWVGQIHGIGAVAGASHQQRRMPLAGQRVLGDRPQQRRAGHRARLRERRLQNGVYRGTETLHARFFTLTASGGGGFPCHGSQPGPSQTTVLKIPKRALRFGHESLKGQAGSAAAENTLWKWSFH